jgi:DNA-binding beta-propeller fold protein YncE
MVVDPTGTFAYVTNSASNDVSMSSIDAATGALTLRVLRRQDLGAKWAQNWGQMGANRGMLVSKGSRINVNFANVGAGDGNRTHVRSLGSFYSAIELRPHRF